MLAEKDMFPLFKIILILFAMAVILSTLIVTIYCVKNILSNLMFIGSLKKVFCSDFDPNPDR